MARGLAAAGVRGRGPGGPPSPQLRRFRGGRAGHACGSGRMFVPLAVTDPEARVDAIVADCSPVIVVTGAEHDEGHGRALRAGPARVPYPTSAARDATPVPSARGGPPGRAAYAIYTSGTTGSPKGVVIGNGAFLRPPSTRRPRRSASIGAPGPCASPRSTSTVRSARLFPTLLAGGAVVIRPRESLLFPRTFFRAVQRERITYTGFSPSYLKLLLASPQMDELHGGTLEVIALGGEASALADIRCPVGGGAPTPGVQPLRPDRDHHRRHPPGADQGAAGRWHGTPREAAPRCHLPPRRRPGPSDRPGGPGR